MNLNRLAVRWKHNQQETWLHLSAVLLLTYILIGGFGGTPVYGVPPDTAQKQQEARNLILQSAQATEHAWEEFHQAAIGGTLASPAVQSMIEGQLHKVRALLMEARKAERAEQFSSVKSLTQNILQITQEIVQASREKKQ
jgi:hypothetical protein